MVEGFDLALSLMKKLKVKLVTKYPVMQYACGLQAGDKVRLKKAIEVKNHSGKVIKFYPKGQIWTILPSAKSKPIVVWLLQEDGERHTWDDDKSLFKTFQVVRSSALARRK